MNKWWIWIHHRLCGFYSDGNRSNFPPVIPNISTNLTTQSLLISCAFDYFDGNDEVNIGLSLSIFEWILPSFLLRTFPLTKRGGPRRNKARLRKRTRIGTVSLIQFHVLFSPEFKLCEWICSRNKNCCRRSERNIRFNEGKGGQIFGKRVTSLPFFSLALVLNYVEVNVGGFFLLSYCSIQDGMQDFRFKFWIFILLKWKMCLFKVSFSIVQRLHVLFRRDIAK